MREFIGSSALSLGGGVGGGGAAAPPPRYAVCVLPMAAEASLERVAVALGAAAAEGAEASWFLFLV